MRGRIENRFVLFALVAILLDLVLTGAIPYRWDQEYWRHWVSHLQRQGFAGFPGNYPPLYVEWLWVVARLFSGLGLKVKLGFPLKFFCLWPVYAAHLVLLRLVWRELRDADAGPGLKSGILALAALSPAILLNGPVWGQVDLFPVALVVLGFAWADSRRGRAWAPLFWALALLTKFQMIALLPVFGALLLRDIRRYRQGILVAAAGVFLVLLPIWAGGGLGDVLRNAYVKSTARYPFATLNAANIWMLLTGNGASDNRVLFTEGVVAQTWLQALCAPKALGMLLFGLYCVPMFLLSFRIRSRARTWQLAFFCTFAFFLLLPGMHERYLLPAVPLALLWAGSDPRRWPWALAASLLCCFNMLLVHPLRGATLWQLLAATTTVAFVALNVRSFLPGLWQRAARMLDARTAPAWIPEAALVFVLAATTTVLALTPSPKAPTRQAPDTRYGPSRVQRSRPRRLDRAGGDLGSAPGTADGQGSP